MTFARSLRSSYVDPSNIEALTFRRCEISEPLSGGNGSASAAMLAGAVWRYRQRDMIGMAVCLLWPSLRSQC